MALKLVIFDCDGVLVDTEGVANDIVAADLTAHGLPITGAQSKEMFVGGTIMGLMAEARKMGADLPDDWTDHIYQKIFARLRQGVEVYAGVTDLLDRIEARGIATAVASNGPMQKMRHSLGPSGLWDRFEGRIYSREHHKPKPAPDMLIHAMAQAGATAAETVMIDDSASGCKSAQNAGVRCFGFAVEGQADKLAAVGAEPVDSMAEIARRLGL